MANVCKRRWIVCKYVGESVRSLASAANTSKCTEVKKSMIGPPHPVSNISPIVLVEPLNESPLEKRLRLHHMAMNERNHQFWLAHNQLFEKEKQEFTARQMKSDEAVLTDGGTLSPDEFASFYKDFLVSRKSSLRAYNRAWLADISLYIRLSFQVQLRKLIHWKR